MTEKILENVMNELMPHLEQEQLEMRQRFKCLQFARIPAIGRPTPDITNNNK